MDTANGYLLQPEEYLLHSSSSQAKVNLLHSDPRKETEGQSTAHDFRHFLFPTITLSYLLSTTAQVLATAKSVLKIVGEAF